MHGVIHRIPDHPDIGRTVKITDPDHEDFGFVGTVSDVDENNEYGINRWYTQQAYERTIACYGQFEFLD